MAEPTTQADTIHRPLPWLAHWTIADERLDGHRSDAYAVTTPDGVAVIDALPLTPAARAGLTDVCAVFMTHGNHQRSAWRFRRELGVPVYAPSDVRGLDEEPDVLVDEETPLPGGLRAIRASGFEQACYLAYAHADGTQAVFCGDLICRDPGGPYRFPVQAGYFDPEGGLADARRLFELDPTVVCAAHAEPALGGGRDVLAGAIRRARPTA